MGSHGLFFSSLSHSFVCVAFGDPKAPFRASRRYICCSFSGKRSFLLFCNHALFLFPSVKPLRMRNEEGEPVERSQHPVFSSVSLKTRCIYLSRQTRTASRLFGTLSVSWDAGDTTLKKKKKKTALERKIKAETGLLTRDKGSWLRGGCFCLIDTMLVYNRDRCRRHVISGLLF